MELGCSFGHTTALFRAGSVTACELAAEPLDVARARCKSMPSIKFVQTDVLTSAASLLELCDNATVAFVDLGGNRAASALIPPLQLLRCKTSEALRLLFVKSRELYTAAITHAVACGGTTTEGGVWSADGACPLPEADRWWEELVRDSTEALDRLNSQARDSGEKRLCFAYLNHGKCMRVGCTFRHVTANHPDAVADAARRLQSGAWRGHGECSSTQGQGGTKSVCSE